MTTAAELIDVADAFEYTLALIQAAGMAVSSELIPMTTRNALVTLLGVVADRQHEALAKLQIVIDEAGKVERLDQ